ncbi:MAG: tRNA pseudouridine(55) synthase TruB [Synergistaceae bacterium]|nr:tRNA pseudouridine(55) synthase TruB [Synergistaceae bacterium]
MSLKPLSCGNIMNAVVLVNKPEGLRSTNCVAIIRKRLGGLKVGHAGTLDSTASGLLVLLTGHATRFSEYVMSLPKVYRAVIQFGVETNTYDYSGDVVSENGYDDVDGEFIGDVLRRFSGMRLQRPPAVSAVKIDGQPAYKLARSGTELDMKERPVFFRRIDILTPYNPDDGTITLEVSCGRGTYIRSLAHDLGVMAGTGAHVKSLERVSTGLFTLKDAIPPDDDISLLPLSRLAENFTRIHIPKRDAKSFINGMSILLSHAERTERGISSVKGGIFVEGDEFLGVGQYAGYDYVRPVVIVPKDEICY